MTDPTAAHVWGCTTIDCEGECRAAPSPRQDPPDDVLTNVLIRADLAEQEGEDNIAVSLSGIRSLVAEIRRLRQGPDRQKIEGLIVDLMSRAADYGRQPGTPGINAAHAALVDAIFPSRPSPSPRQDPEPRPMTTKLTDAEIAELRRIENATVPAPWEYVDRDDIDDGASIEPNVLWLGPLDTEERRAARLVIAARNALPSMLDEIEASRASPPPDLVAAAERVWSKFGAASDWTEWRDLREALDGAAGSSAPLSQDEVRFTAKIRTPEFRAKVDEARARLDAQDAAEGHADDPGAWEVYEDLRSRYASACERMGMAHANGTRAEWEDAARSEIERRLALNAQVRSLTSRGGGSRKDGAR